VLFAGLMTAYLAVGGPHPVSDALVNMVQPVQALAGGGITISPREAPFMFEWELEEPYRTRWEFSPPLGPKPLYVGTWSDPILGSTTGELYGAGMLKIRQPLYYLVPSAREGRYVNIYGPGAGLAAVPYFAALALVDGGWREDLRTVWGEARVFASACVAASAVFVYFAALLHLKRRAALLLAALYGLGTCVWCELTQLLWQQTPTLLFIAMGLYFLFRLPESARMAVAAGLSLGAASLCRPTAGLLLLAAAVHVFLREKKARLPFAAGVAGPLLLLAAFNYWTLGSPFRFGQALAATSLSSGPEVFQPSSFFEGVAGLLISPSRGLLVFSPFVAFSIWGAVTAWRSPAFPVLRAASLAFAASLLVTSKWISWYGGWSFGYRILAEWSPLLVLLLIPVAPRLLERPVLRAAFLLCAAVAVGIQALGAGTYDMEAWNGRPAYVIHEGGRDLIVVPRSAEEEGQLDAAARTRPIERVAMDIDRPEFRRRLWSVSDGQIAYLLTRPGVAAECAASKRRALETAARQKWGAPAAP